MLNLRAGDTQILNKVSEIYGKITTCCIFFRIQLLVSSYTPTQFFHWYMRVIHVAHLFDGRFMCEYTVCNSYC